MARQAGERPPRRVNSGAKERQEAEIKIKIKIKIMREAGFSVDRLSG
jgi:hypothetical protein